MFSPWPQLIDAAKSSRGLPLRKFTLPVDIVASTDDRVLPSVKEAERLVRLAYALSAAWNRVTAKDAGRAISQRVVKGWPPVH